jgi:hypothetical protein
LRDEEKVGKPVFRGTDNFANGIFFSRDYFRMWHF